MPIIVQDPGIKDMWGEQVTAQATPDTTAANRRTINLRRGFRYKLLRNTDPTALDDLRYAYLPKITYVYWYDDSQTQDADKWINILGDSQAMLD